ncbi:PAS domain-containing sensor histidine kinase [Methylobacter sp. YRD-M1]|uniref:PAS domain-containing sensor histidine kinase n=1 Tax=Methylobacter sp. YRD-M1 TaxID=2911520 RepID=UPI00227CED37|nr:PAS domain S-box protein [Methylobacter sp. YRD-M1]WAK00894.1 PAS domain S-box protein [Methylobacter sp. YRD-M1]
MFNSFDGNIDYEILQTDAENLLVQYRENLRKRAETMLNKSGTDITRMSSQEIQKLLFEFQVHQIELELQNEELNRTHQELLASRDLYANLYNLSPVGYLTLNKDGVILQANLTATRLLNHSIEELINRKLAQYIDSNDQDQYYLFLRRLATERTHQSLDVRLKSDNSEITYVECQGKINDINNNDSEIWLTLNNITERKHAEETIANLNKKLAQKVLKQDCDLSLSNQNLTKLVEELKHSKQQILEREAKLNSIFNASVEGIITCDMSCKIISVNAAVETIFGYTEAELIGCSINKLMPLSQDKCSHRERKSYRQEADMPKVLGRIREVEGMRKDGSAVPLDISIAEFTLDGQDYFTSIVRDVTQRKMQELQQKEHLEALSHVMRLGLMGELASGIAHEVNQPLTAIVNYAQACLRFIQADQPDLAKLRSILEKTHDQALKAGQIIHHMRDFVRSKKIHRSTADINALIENAVSLSITDLKQYNIQLSFSLADNLPTIYVDSVQIEQVILNLVRNSIDALKDVSHNKQRKLFIQTLLNDENFIEVKVKDNGHGLGESSQKKILTPFYTTKSSGMGMGLSISQSIVKSHDGSLHFASKPGKGSTFYFTIPVRRKSNDA